MSGAELSSEQWARLESLFERASELPPGERNRFIEAEAADEPAVAKRLRSMLESAERADEQLAATLLGALDSLPDPRAGQTVGPYRLIEVIGHGGMGTVYRAERADEAFDKQVAVKIIRTHLAGSRFARRFLQERQILAGLEHPNIARLIDGGSTGDGLPYLVLEYVDGEPLDLWCDRLRLSVDERLRLFCRMLEAVAYAHRHLVVHRDLKPSNILVTPEGVPKLLDFGIAKLLSPELPDAAASAAPETRPDLRTLTPEYASPEQVQGLPVSTATDLYALGLILYELLTGHRPYRVDSTSPVEMAQTICEVEPPKPSALLRDGATSEDAEAAAAARGTTPERLAKRLRGDLDNIVMMALRKEPERRYASLGDMARDIERHRDGLPVSARPNTFGYRAGKFLRRHKVSVAATAVAMLALVAATVISLDFAAGEARQRALAEARFADVRELATTFLYDVHDAVVNDGPTAAGERLVATGTEYLDALGSQVIDDPALARRVDMDLARGYTRMAAIQADPSIASRGDIEAATPAAQRGLARAEALLTDSPDDPAVLLTASEAHRVLGGVLSHQDELADSVAHFEEALRLRDVAEANASGLTLERPRRDVIHWSYAHALTNAGRHEEAIVHLRQAASLLEALAARHPERADLADQALAVRAFEGQAHQRAGQMEDARAVLEPLIADIERELDNRPANPALLRAESAARANLGRVYEAAGKMERAEAELLQALVVSDRLAVADPDNVMVQLNVSVSHHFLGKLYDRAGDPERALRHFEQMLAANRRIAEANPNSLNFRRQYAVALDMTGFALRKLDRKEEALEHHREANELFAAIAGVRPDDLDIRRSVAVSWYFLGQLERDIALDGGQTAALREQHLGDAIEAFETARRIMVELREAGDLPPGDDGVIEMLADEAEKTRELVDDGG